MFNLQACDVSARLSDYAHRLPTHRVIQFVVATTYPVLWVQPSAWRSTNFVNYVPYGLSRPILTEKCTISVLNGV